MPQGTTFARNNIDRLKQRRRYKKRPQIGCSASTRRPSGASDTYVRISASILSGGSNLVRFNVHVQQADQLRHLGNPMQAQYSIPAVNMSRSHKTKPTLSSTIKGLDLRWGGNTCFCGLPLATRTCRVEVVLAEFHCTAFAVAPNDIPMDHQLHGNKIVQ